MRKRWKVVLLIVMGVLALVVGGLLLALRLSSPPLSVSPISAERKDLPEAWLVPDDPSAFDASEDRTSEPPSSVVDDPTDDSASFSTSGTLAFVGDGRSFGEESYELVIADDAMTLTSFGHFRFKVLVATINIAFEQRLVGDGDLRPSLYEASFDAPLGFDRTVHSEIADGRAVILSGGEHSEIELDVDRAFVIGTFGAYALLPVLFPLREEGGIASFDLLVLGGPPNQEDQGPDAVPRMTVERIPDVEIRVADAVLSVDAYVVTSGFGQSTLLAKEKEFLGFVSGDEEESLRVYRVDYFPDGFEILTDPGESQAIP
ncbi:MAG: hypothetical protein WBC63_08345 [Candidatus Bipolaricaulia bacterium]